MIPRRRPSLVRKSKRGFLSFAGLLLLPDTDPTWAMPRKGVYSCRERDRDACLLSHMLE